jgi:AraC family transcriptional regulator
MQLSKICEAGSWHAVRRNANTGKEPMPGPYEARLLRVLDYIHDHPDGDLSLDRLADVAAMSRFHWHRVFRGMTGETCAQAVRRIRLHRAACRLVQSDCPVAEVATAVGIPNVQSFTRMFGTAYGMSPVAFRNRGELRPPRLQPGKGVTMTYPIDVTEIPAMRLAAVPHRGAYMEVSQAFERLGTILSSRNLWPQAGGIVGVYYDDPAAVPEAELRSHAGVAFEGEIPEGLDEVRLDGGRAAVLHFKGPYAGLPTAYDYLYGEWLPKSGEEPRDAPATEIYRNTPADTAPDDLLTDICLPIR